MYLTTEAADNCPVTRASCTVGGTGPQGPTGPSGPQGPAGPPGALNYTERQQLKEEILATVREEMSTRNCCNLLCERFSTSCKELYQCNPALSSGHYNLWTPQGVERVYCVMNTTNCGNITRGWMRAAYIDMTDSENTCPESLNSLFSPPRACARHPTPLLVVLQSPSLHTTSPTPRSVGGLTDTSMLP